MCRRCVLILGILACMGLSLRVSAGDTAATPQASLQELAVLSDAVAVARVGAATAAPASEGGALALWIERALKGRLQSDRDIIWVPRKELPKAEPGPALWLLFLARNADGSWHVQTGGRESNPIKLDSPNAAVVGEVSRYAGAYGARAEPEAPTEAEISLWIKKAGTGSHDTRREAFAKLLAAGDAARVQLLQALSSPEREIAAVARTLLPLTGGGAAVNGVRLILEPGMLTIKEGERRNVTVNLANLSEHEINVVTGQAAWGDNLQAAAAYEMRAQSPVGAGAKKAGEAPAAPTVLPQAYGQAPAGSARPLPLVRTAPALGTVALAVEVQLERATVDGKEALRLKFPHGYIVVGKGQAYSLRAHFDCPGPRPDQRRLMDANYWAGGQLVSNEIVVKVEP